MSYEVTPTKKFTKELKRLVKKYPSLKEEYSDLISDLQENSTFGTPLGRGCYKIHISIASRRGRKSGGGQVITYLKFAKNAIFEKRETEKRLPDKSICKLPFVYKKQMDSNMKP